MADKTSGATASEESPVEVEIPAIAEPVLVGSLPNATDGVSGPIRFTALIDAEFENGNLVSIGFGAAQYTIFAGHNGHLAVRSAFPRK